MPRTPRCVVGVINPGRGKEMEEEAEEGEEKRRAPVAATEFRNMAHLFFGERLKLSAAK